MEVKTLLENNEFVLKLHKDNNEYLLRYDCYGGAKGRDKKDTDTMIFSINDREYDLSPYRRYFFTNIIFTVSDDNKIVTFYSWMQAGMQRVYLDTIIVWKFFTEEGRFEDYSLKSPAYDFILYSGSTNRSLGEDDMRYFTVKNKYTEYNYGLISATHNFGEHYSNTFAYADGSDDKDRELWAYQMKVNHLNNKPRFIDDEYVYKTDYLDKSREMLEGFFIPYVKGKMKQKINRILEKVNYESNYFSPTHLYMLIGLSLKDDDEFLRKVLYIPIQNSRIMNICVDTNIKEGRLLYTPLITDSREAYFSINYWLADNRDIDIEEKSFEMMVGRFNQKVRRWKGSDYSLGKIELKEVGSADHISDKYNQKYSNVYNVYHLINPHRRGEGMMY